MIWVIRPFNWVSAHREVTFKLDYEHVYDLVIVGDSGGKANFVFDYDGINNLQVGDYFFVDSGIYKGYHKIKEIPFPFSYVSETDYIADQTTGTLKFIEDTVIVITAGYHSGFLADLQPYKVVATFKPEPNIDGILVFNISGYLNKLFDVINSNDTFSFGGITVYPNLFAQYQVNINGAYAFTGNVLNAAIDQYELNRDYVGTNRDLNGGSLENHYTTCGIYDAMRIYSDWVVQSEVYTDGVPGGLAADFSLADFDPNDFST